MWAGSHGVLSYRQIHPAHLVVWHQPSLQRSQVRQIDARAWDVWDGIIWQRDHQLSVRFEPLAPLELEDIYTGPTEISHI